jgi:hypothetical protein
MIPHHYDSYAMSLLSENSPADMARETRKFLKEIIEREGRERIWPI